MIQSLARSPSRWDSCEDYDGDEDEQDDPVEDREHEEVVVDDD